jgi:hypothetical protein
LNTDETLAALGLSRVNAATLIWHDPASTEIGVRLLSDYLVALLSFFASGVNESAAEVGCFDG